MRASLFLFIERTTAKLIEFDAIKTTILKMTIHWTTGEKEGRTLFLYATSNRLQTLRYVICSFASRCLPHIFNQSTWNYQTVIQ